MSIYVYKYPEWQKKNSENERLHYFNDTHLSCIRTELSMQAVNSIHKKILYISNIKNIHPHLYFKHIFLFLFFSESSLSRTLIYFDHDLNLRIHNKPG
jgi:hypothetical protein